MTNHIPIDQPFLDAVAKWERNPTGNISYNTMRHAIFRMAAHIRNMHDAHEKAFQAGVDYQKMMEKQK